MVTNSEQNITAANLLQPESELFSNAFFAYGLAQMVFRYIQDVINSGSVDAQTPIYIFDFNSKCGKLSYLILRKLTDFLRLYKITNCKICYVIADGSNAKLQLFKTSPFFAEFIQQNVLDFATFLSGQNSLELQLQNKSLDRAALKSPTVFLANNFELTAINNLLPSKALIITSRQDKIPSTATQATEAEIVAPVVTSMPYFTWLRDLVLNLGGDAFIPAAQEEFKVGIFSIGNKFAELPNVSWAHDHFYSHCSSLEYWRMKEYMVNNPNSFDLDNTLSLLKYGYWDADVLMGVAKPYAKIINQATPGYINTLKDGLVTLGRNYYFCDPQKNVAFELGHLYHLIGDLDLAFHWYNIALRDFGPSSPLQFNLGLCNYYKQDVKAALECFQQAVALDPENADAKNWVDHIQKEQAAG